MSQVEYKRGFAKVRPATKLIIDCSSKIGRIGILTKLACPALQRGVLLFSHPINRRETSMAAAGILRLQRAGFSEQQVEALAEYFDEQMATKADLASGFDLGPRLILRLRPSREGAGEPLLDNGVKSHR